MSPQARRGNERGGGHTVSFEKRPRFQQIVRVPVIEGDDDAPTRDTSGREHPGNFAHGQQLAVPPRYFQMLREVPGGHRELPRIPGHLRDAVIHEHDHGPRQPGPGACQDPADPGLSG